MSRDDEPDAELGISADAGGLTNEWEPERRRERFPGKRELTGWQRARAGGSRAPSLGGSGRRGKTHMLHCPRLAKSL